MSISDKLIRLRIERLYKRYHQLRNRNSHRMKDKLDKLRKIKNQRIFVDKLMLSSQAIGRSYRSGSGNYLITSSEVAHLFNSMLGTQSNGNE